MTQIITFLFQQIKKMYEFGTSYTFEFFGQRVSVFSLIAGFSIIFMLLQFLRLFVPTESGSGLGRIGMGRNENLRDKMQERRELFLLKSGARHVNYSGARHTRKYHEAKQTSERSDQ